MEEIEKEQCGKGKKLADYYNVSIDYLLDRTNNPHMQK